MMGLLRLKAKVRSKKAYCPQAVREASDNILNRCYILTKVCFTAPRLIERNWLRKGWCKVCRAKERWDNAPVERFFGTLKTESFYQEGALSVAALTEVIDDDIHDYNHERMSLNLKKLSPVGYRTQLEKAV